MTGTRGMAGIVAVAALAWAGPGSGAVGAAEVVAAQAGEAQERHRLGSAVASVYNLAGAVEVVRGDGPEVVVVVNRGGRDGERLEVERVERGGETALIVRYPAETVIYPRPEGGNYNTTIRLADDGSWGDDGQGGGWFRGLLGRDRVRLRSSGSGLEAHADLRIEVPAGGAVDVFVAVGGIAARGLAADLTLDIGVGGVQVRDVQGEVSVDTGSGAVTVAGVEGPVEVDTGSGAVTVERMRGPALHIDTGSGRVSATDVEAGVVEVDTGSGAVRLAAIAAAELEVDTGSGSVEAELTSPIDRVEIDTGSGAITLVVPAATDAELVADSGSGGVEVDLPIEVERRERSFLHGRLGDGRGRITLDTGSGRIRVAGG